MGKLFKYYLTGPQIYTCSECECHLALREDVISKGFNGRSGPAYLFDSVVNVHPGPKEERRLMTGIHIVADIFCVSCRALLGWKYFLAYEESQKYKEGKFILEKAKIKKVKEAD